ncbi:hypothetical protein ABZ921_32865 [Streptomyces atriruber]|uniref:Uncharacterized protein n=1 Tax=Streptomyces atriruber TaxID=545121 RepID=A0ABV3BWN3_9ACTN
MRAELGVPGDVDMLADGLDAALRAYGESAIDILVHNELVAWRPSSP